MYKILNSAGNDTEILLYSLIEGGYTAGRLIKALQDIPPDSTITLRINSDGGEIFDAIALYNYLKDKSVHVIIDGICASAASVVAMSGKRITMKQGSLMMIHNPLTFAIGNADELRIQADILDKITESIISIYQAKTNMEHDDIMNLMKAESWMNETEALSYGFVDEIEASQPQESPAEPSPSTLSTRMFEDGVKAERERLRALDELYTPSRAAILNAAKYKTGQSAEQIALEILKAEARNSSNAGGTEANGKTLPEVNNFPAKDEGAELDAFIAAVNRKKGR